MRFLELAKKAWNTNRLAAATTAVLLVAVLLSGAYNSLVLKPRSRELEERLIERQRRLREKDDSRAAGGVPLEERLKKGAADVQIFWQRIPPRQEFPELLSELMNLASEAGLSLDRVQYRPDEKPREGLFRYAMAFSLNADYTRLKKFVYLLENSSRLLIIDQISLSGSSGGVRLNVAVSTYFRE